MEVTVLERWGLGVLKKVVLADCKQPVLMEPHEQLRPKLHPDRRRFNRSD